MAADTVMATATEEVGRFREAVDGCWILVCCRRRRDGTSSSPTRPSISTCHFRRIGSNSASGGLIGTAAISPERMPDSALARR
jgi:hypothetical protein